VPSPGQGQLWVTRGLAWWCTGALDDAQQAGVEAKRLAEESGNVRDFVDATMVLAMVAHERGAWPQRVSLDLLDARVRPELAAVVMDAHLCLAESYLYGGVPYPEVIRFAQDLQRQAAAANAPRAEAFATTLLGEAHLLMGDAETAFHHLRSAADQHRRVGVLCGEALSLQRLAQAFFALGNTGEGQAALSGALMAARGSPVGTRHLLDRVHGTAIRSAPDPRSAVLAVDEATHAVRGLYETCPPCSINLTVPAAIACADAGDLERATRYLTFAEHVAAAFYPRAAGRPRSTRLGATWLGPRATSRRLAACSSRRPAPSSDWASVSTASAAARTSTPSTPQPGAQPGPGPGAGPGRFEEGPVRTVTATTVERNDTCPST
jgi:tetratricopeptide (TPR) repeat protein